MKKILAILLSVLMLTSTGVIGVIFASAGDTSSGGAVTIDGKFDEPAWVADGWVNVNNSNAKIQTALKEGEIRKENYDFQMRTDASNLYVAVKFNAPPVATDAKCGNGNGTTFRLWTYTDGMKDASGAEFITYNYIIEYYYKPSGDVFVVRKNTNALGNSSTDVTSTSGATASSTKGDDYWQVEMQIPFALLGSTVGSHFYLTLSSPTAINGTTVVGNNSWAYPYYGDGMESNGNADAMYVEWNKNNDLDITFEDIRIGKLPATAQKIDSFGTYVGGTTTVITRVKDKTTLGEISEITDGSIRDYNYFYLVAVGADNRVTEINQTLGRPDGVKSGFVVPEGGFVLLCNGNLSDTHTQAMIDAFKAIKVGDFISLYNVDLAALAADAVKTDLTNAGFTVSKKVKYAAGVTMEADPAKVTANKALGVLADGKTELIDANKNFSDEQVVLFQNLVCKEAGNFPVVDLILNLGTPIKFDTVNLSFYHQHDVMIGLPKDNKITVSYANDPANFTALGDYTFEGAAAAGTKGVLPANLALGKTILAQYVKISFAFGKAPWETDGKTNWEFIGMTEFAVSASTPATGYTNLSNADQVVANKAFTTLGDGKTALADETKKFNDAQVVLFQNKVCTTANVFPKVELVLAYAAPKTIDTITLGFYHEYDVMIGLPKDNKVSVSYSNDHAAGYTALGDITLEGAAEAGKNGVITYNYKLENAIKARFIKISFEFGKAPWETDGKTNWEFIGMTEFNAYGYAEGVINNSASADVAVLNGRSLRALIDGKVAPSLQTFNNGAVVLFQNKKTATAGTYPTVDLTFTFSESKTIDTAKLSFYHEYISMIGLPKDNKVTISYANNYNSFTKLGDYTFEGAAESGKKGVIDAVIPLGTSVTAKYVKVTFQYGDSPFAAQNKPVWEFIALTEVNFANFSSGAINTNAPDALVSVGKTYTGTSAARSGWTDTDPATKLTDGNVGSLDKLGGSGPFVGFQVVKNVPYTYTSGAWTAGTISYNPDERDENGNFYKVIDLGENVKSIYKYSVKFGQIAVYNILFPSKVEFYASNDNINFYKVGDGVKGSVENNGAATLKEWVDYTFESSTGITARYIKVAITPTAFTEEMTPAPTAAGNEGDTQTVTKPLVTAVSEISVIAKSTGVLPVYSDTPVKTNGHPIDYVTAENTTYPTGYGNYTASLTDNVVATSGSYDNKWYGFYYGTAAGVNTVNGIGTIKVDLGANKNIGGFRVHIWQPVSSGIGVPEITVYGSVNDYDWLEIGRLTNPTEKVGWATLTLEKELPIRYVRFDVRQVATGQVFVFINEVEVLSYLHEKTFSVDFANQYTVGYQNPSTWTYNGGGSLAGVGDAVYIFTPDKGSTLGEAANPGIAWWQVWVIDWDATAKHYYIKEFYPVNNGSSKAGIAIPDKGFVVASCGHGNQAFDPMLTTDVAIGAPVYVYGMDIQKLGVKDTMDFVTTNEIAVFAPVDGKTEFVPDFTPDLPTDALVINNFGDYVGSTMSIYTRVSDKTTLGEVSAITFGAAKDFNLFYLIAVDSDGKVTLVNQTVDANKAPESIKKDVVIPEGGYLLLCSSVTSATHTQTIIDAFKAIKVGDTITLYNVDLQALATGAVKKDLNKAGFTVKTTVNYAVGVNNVSDPDKIGQNKQNLSVLTDGKTDLEVPTAGFGDAQVVLFQNKSATTAGVYPSVELVLNLGEEKTFNTIDLSFYIEYNSMIGLPKGNKISISYATDPEKFVALADYTFEGEAKSGDKKVFNVHPKLGTSIKAQYVKIVFSYGDSPWQDKPVWEWIGFTEIGVSTSTVTDLPTDAFVIDNYGGYSATTTLYTRNGGKTTIGEVCELIRGSVKDYNYAYLVAVDANGKVTAVNYVTGPANGKKDTFVIPEGGYVLLCNLNTSTTHTQTVIDNFKKIVVGDTITLINVDLGALATAKSEITLEKAGFTVTNAAEEDPFELKNPGNTNVEVKDGLLLGITDKMTVDDIKALFAGNVTVEGIGTGKTVSAGGKTIVIVILGDLNGDGEIGHIDLLRVKKALIGNYTLTGLELKAACIRGADRPNQNDYLKMKKHAIGTYNIFSTGV